MNTSPLCLTARLGPHTFAVPIGKVVSVGEAPRAIPVGQGSAHLRGAGWVQDRYVSLVDLRASWGLPTLTEERDALLAPLDQVVADHEAWLARLIEDPHASHDCAYAGWREGTASLGRLTRLLEELDGVHQGVHTLVDDVREARRAGNDALAERRLRRARTRELSRLRLLCEHVCNAIRSASHAVAVTLSLDGAQVAVLVDHVRQVEPVERLERRGDMEIVRTADALHAIVLDDQTLLRLVG